MERSSTTPNRLRVPATPGELTPVGQRAHRQRDELDSMVDELFGAPTDERPGRLDAALIVIGLAVLVWWLIAREGNGVLFLGIALLLIGLVLPLRSIRRGIVQRRAARANAALQGARDVLDAADPVVLDLATAYEDLAAAAKRSGASEASEALAAGHQAVAEVASLLAGRTPIVEGEVEYVRKRTDAVRALASELQRSHEVALESKALRLDRERREHQMRASALAAARGELDELDPSDSIDELARLTQRLREENDDARL